MSYSHFIRTLYDEKQSVGWIGNGAHYSVLEGLTPVDVKGQRWGIHPSLHFQKFAVIWDRDHDTRIIGVIEEALFNGFLFPVKYIGENKGRLVVVVDNEFWGANSDNKQFVECWEIIVKNSIKDDSWKVNIVSEHSAELTSLIPEEKNNKITTYLKNIDNLWSLGTARP